MLQDRVLALEMKIKSMETNSFSKVFFEEAFGPTCSSEGRGLITDPHIKTFMEGKNKGEVVRITLSLTVA